MTHKTLCVLVPASSLFLLVTSPLAMPLTPSTMLQTHHLLSDPCRDPAPSCPRTSARTISLPRTNFPNSLAGYLLHVVEVSPKMSFIQRALLLIATLGCVYLCIRVSEDIKTQLCDKTLVLFPTYSVFILWRSRVSLELCAPTQTNSSTTYSHPAGWRVLWGPLDQQGQ